MDVQCGLWARKCHLINGGRSKSTVLEHQTGADQLGERENRKTTNTPQTLARF
ncbi:hypothetical protein BDF20DRAFT_370891 [Mycotypha africana]|uniref:uncharacterized protein n=1 Tax=Mycotypha africana TaxID=64632 RepID=UPI0023003B40|nr:uncharacterized protein BDF20DRAFT_370891 [Mycotypha africana]KAI8984193.1 hypothetical protein BDF20DRAFT_370891 [Mycotypha africana]